MSTKTKVSIGVAVAALVVVLFSAQTGLFKGTLGVNGVWYVVRQADFLPSVVSAPGLRTVAAYDVQLAAGAPRTKLTALKIRFSQSNKSGNQNTNLSNLKLYNRTTDEELAASTATVRNNIMVTFYLATKNIWMNAGDTLPVYIKGYISNPLPIAPATASLNPSIPQQTGVLGVTASSATTKGPDLVVPLTPLQLQVTPPSPVGSLMVNDNLSFPSPSNLASGQNQRIGSFKIKWNAVLDAEAVEMRSMSIKFNHSSIGLLKRVALKHGVTGLDISQIFNPPSDRNEASFTFEMNGSVPLNPGEEKIIDIYADIDSLACTPAGAIGNYLTGVNIVKGAGMRSGTIYTDISEVVMRQGTVLCSGVPPVHPELTVSKNINMGNETILNGGINTKIAAFDIKVGSSEALKITSVGLQLGGTFDAEKMWNYRLLRIEGPGVTRQFGTTVSASPSDKKLNFSSVPALDLSINSTATFHLVADLASEMPVGATIITNIQSGGVQGSGVTSLSSFQAMGEPVWLQTVTVAAPSLRISQAPGSGSLSEVSPGIRGQEVMRLRFAPNANMEVTRFIFSITGSHSHLIEKVKLEVPGSGSVIGPSDGVVPDASGKATFTGLQYGVGPSGYGNELIVKVDILSSSSLPFGTTSNPFATFQVGILAEADVEAVVLAGSQIVHASGVPVNGSALQIRLPVPPPPPMPVCAVPLNTVQQISLPFDRFVPGAQVSLARFSVNAPNPSYNFGGLVFKVASSADVTVDSFTLYDVTNNRDLTGDISIFGVSGTGEKTVTISFNTPSEIFFGAPVTYELRASVSSDAPTIGDFITTRLEKVNGCLEQPTNEIWNLTY